MIQLLATSLIVALISAQPQAGEPRENKQSDWAAMSMADLIAELPEAGEELIWDAAVPEWYEHPASLELRARIVRGELNDEDSVRALKAARVIAFHEQWPEGRPLAISLRSPLWLGWSGRVEVNARFPDAQHVKQRVIYGGCAVGNDSRRAEREYIEIGALPANPEEVVFDLDIWAGPLKKNARQTRWQGLVAYRIEIVESERDSIQAVGDPAFEDALRGAVWITIGKNGARPPRTAMWLKVRRTAEFRPFLEKYGGHALVEILDGEEVVDHFEIDVRKALTLPRLSYYRDVLEAQLLEDEEFVGRLRLRISGPGEQAFEDLRRDSCWAGVIEMPLSKLLETRRMPNRDS